MSNKSFFKKMLSKYMGKSDEQQTVLLDGEYSIYSDRESTTDKLNELSDILHRIEPYSDTFRLKSSKIEIVSPDSLSTIIREYDPDKPSQFIAKAFTIGDVTSSIDQHVVVLDSDMHLIVHELGHVIDRYSDGDGTIPFSLKDDFLPVFNKYCQAITRSVASVDDQIYLKTQSEAFAHLFEQHCKVKMSDLTLTQQTSDFSELVSDVYQDAEVQKYFDSILPNLERFNTFSTGIDDLSKSKQLSTTR